MKERLDEIMNSKIENKTEPRKEFDFDYWCKLAKNDPEAFEKARSQEIDQHISSISDSTAQERMKRLQWRVEMERKRSKNPMDSAIRIYDMMWEAVGKNFEAIQDLADTFNQGASKSVEGLKPQAKVLKFNREEQTGTAG